MPSATRTHTSPLHPASVFQGACGIADIAGSPSSPANARSFFEPGKQGDNAAADDRKEQGNRRDESDPLIHPAIMGNDGVIGVTDPIFVNMPDRGMILQPLQNHSDMLLNTDQPVMVRFLFGH